MVCQEIFRQLPQTLVFEEQGFRQRAKDLFQLTGQLHHENRIDAILFHGRVGIEVLQGDLEGGREHLFEVMDGPVAELVRDGAVWNDGRRGFAPCVGGYLAAFGLEALTQNVSKRLDQIAGDALEGGVITR